MKKPEQLQHLLDHIRQMDHRERIIIEIPKDKTNSLPPYSYAMEIYVTWDYNKAKIGDIDPYRVLFQVVTCEGKQRDGMPKTSIKRNYLNTKSGVLPKVWEMI